MSRDDPCRLLPAMLEAGRGRIVNLASTAGMTGYRYVAAYCAAKHGLIGMTRALALEYMKQPIRVNAVCPGWVRTDMGGAGAPRSVTEGAQTP